MKASVIDYVRDDLDPTIWDLAEGEPQLRKAVKMQIIDTVMSALDDFDIPESAVKGLFVYGSLLTNQYNESTDLDCRVLLYKEPMDKLYPGLTGEDIFDYLRDYLHGIPLEDSKHPLNVSVMIEGEDQELGRTEFDPVYDVLTDKFIQLPVFSPSDFDPQQEFGEARDQVAMVMEYLDKTLREAKTKTIDYEVLEEAMSEVEHPEELRSRLEAKLQEIKTDLQELVEDYEQIKDERSKALTTEIEGNPHKEPGNVLYKYLERYQYLDMLKKIKHIMKHGLEHEEIPELEEALKIASKDDVYIEKLEVEGAPADLEIWLVDGGLVRKDYFIDFTLGGHDLVYDFIPHKQIWIDDDTAKDELKYVVKHELDERAEMEEGKSYDEAHEDASEVEQASRRAAKHPKDMTPEELLNFEVPSMGDRSRNPKDVERLRSESSTLLDYIDDEWALKDWLGAGSTIEDMSHLVPMVKANQPIKVYRATDTEDVIFPGAYVTPSRKYAELHAELTISGDHLLEPKEAKILEAEARPDELVPMNPLEFFYAPASVDEWHRKIKGFKVTGKIRAYHGSNEPDIEELAAYKPNLQYGGDIGYGVYVSENYETAAFYGQYVYVLDVDIDHSDIFDLSAENQSLVEGFEGTSVLTGEFIPPFYFFIGKNKYLVGSADDSDFGADYQAKEMLIKALESNSLDILVPIVRKYDRLPDLDDIKWDLSDMEWDLDENQIEAAEAALLDQAAPLISAAEEWRAANEATVIDLDEIGAEVEAAGYKALYFERGGTVGDEILVFDPTRIRIVSKEERNASN